MDQSSRRNGQKTKAELAKGATERQEIDVFIDISLSYLKHRIRAKYGNQWNQTWKNSTNGGRTRANFPNVVVRTEINLTLEFFLTQFLTGHGKFNENRWKQQAQMWICSKSKSHPSVSSDD